MKPFPPVVLHLLQQLPEETHEVRLHTDGHGKWTIETLARYRVQEPGEVPTKTALVPVRRGSKARY